MELEHRTVKSRYKRTSRKGYLKQLTQIERREFRLRRIRRKFNETRKLTLKPDKRPESSACRYHIGKTQNNPINLGSFLQENRHDPAVKVKCY